MRKVASYAFTASLESAEVSRPAYDRTRGIIDSWVLAKGELNGSGENFEVRYRDGRLARLRKGHCGAGASELRSWDLDEPISDGVFRTSLGLGVSGQEVVFSCVLDVGKPGPQIGPVAYDARCPNVIRDVLALPFPWGVSGVSLRPDRLRLVGREGGTRLAALVRDEKRPLPLVVVSEQEGFQVHPELDVGLAYDLAGMALVAAIDDDAAWTVTRTLGSQWSCFNGAIRVYWPASLGLTDPFRHELWTSTRLMEGVETTERAASRLRGRLRRLLFEMSCYAGQRPRLFQEIEASVRREEQKALLQAASEARDYQQLFEDALRENERLSTAVGRLEAENRDLGIQLSNERLLREYAEQQVPAGTSVEEPPPQTVADAVSQARRLLTDELVFGDDVDRGVQTLATSAGPPDKILRWLRGLAELAHTHRRGPLGASIANWLSQRSMATTRESETIRNSGAEMRKRTWHDGTGRRKFESHMKVTDATSPDRCVRIYFEWDATAVKVLVGWIGRHPR